MSEFEPTLDREVRLTPTQIAYLSRVTSRRINDLGRKISRAEDAARKGATIQRGTLQHHYNELQDLCRVRETLDVARRQIQHKVRERLGMES